jgi:NDP-sugar pyrophosphorylase family protein
MDVVILAAGKGKRLMPLTEKVPKPLLEIRGKPILEHIIGQLSDKGFKKIYFVVGYSKEKIIDFVNNIKNKYNINAEFIFQKKQLGTAHAVSLLPEKISDPFLVLTADTIIHDAPYKKAIGLNKHFLLVKKTKNAKRLSVIETEGNRISKIYYNYSKDYGSLVFTDINFYVIPKKTIEYAKRVNYDKEIYLSAVIDKMIAEGEVFEFIEFTGELEHISSLENLKD